MLYLVAKPLTFNKMSYITPFCSQQASNRNNVFHLDDRCTEGNNIEEYNRILYSGYNRSLCEHCAQLSQTPMQHSPYNLLLNRQLGVLGIYQKFIRTALTQKV